MVLRPRLFEADGGNCGAAWPGPGNAGLTVPTTGPAGAFGAKPPLTITGAAGPAADIPGAGALGMTPAPGSGGCGGNGAAGVGAGGNAAASRGFCVGIITLLGGAYGVFDCSGAGGGGENEGAGSGSAGGAGAKTCGVGSGSG